VLHVVSNPAAIQGGVLSSTSCRLDRTTQAIVSGKKRSAAPYILGNKPLPQAQPALPCSHLGSITQFAA